ncbi:MAG: hypothetical protein FVQ83_01195 [Chloroflexi bacterium]|nr:hypothetical protein [Chloroflexota bacterium]
MKTKSNGKIAIIILVLMAVILACGPSASTTTPPPPPPQEAAPSDTPGAAPPSVEGSTPQATAVLESTLTPTATVAHLTQPSDPGTVNSFVVDRSSENLASERRAIADSFNFDLFERPFTSEVMDYLAYLDITRGELSVAAPWVYITIYLEGAPPNGSSASYGIEIDLDVDGRGDWLIIGVVPDSTNWTTNDMRAYQDSAGDVGGLTPVLSDAPDPALNGYDDLVFDQGYGPDPDAAWIRRDPTDPNHVQLAFKHSLIASDAYFLWGVWSDEGVKQPGWFDYNDHFTLVEAGSPAIESSEYPIKALAALDNTCRWGYGFVPTGSEPGACYVPPTPTPTLTPTLTPTPEPAAIGGSVFWDANINGVRGIAELGISGQTITLGVGACNSSGFASDITDSGGYYNFDNLPAGTYCVTSNVVTNSCGGWWPTTATQTTITLPPGGIDYFHFGYESRGPC